MTSTSSHLLYQSQCESFGFLGMRITGGIGSRLFLSEEADAAGESPTFVVAKGEEAGRVNVIVDVGVVAVACDVVEASADGPIVAQGMEALFDVGIESEPSGEAAGAGRFNQLELVVYDVKRKARPQFGGVGEVETFVDGEQSPGEEAVGGIPGIGAGLLGAELRIVDVEVEDLVGA